MSIFKCKMCGGALEINNNETVATCEYCGTQQTLPKLDDEKRANLYDRANHFRRNNEFDKAMGIYEQILNEDSSDSEAYWSLVLCRYGIEYVEDPTTHKRVPTVNRAQFTSIYDDDNYKSALQYADGYQKSIYEEEAKAINEIQKGILAISQKEEPFDVFICYKETDNSGRRTHDSVLANDLYHQLTQEGFKVFFARITLEDKLGSAYEPYIFAALNSSKVMVVLGTKPEFFNAVWVKNEWSRYLALIKNGAKKMLIPAYKDMDPYDLPEEFSHLQAQDMSKLGFMQDLIRGIKKIVGADEQKETVIKETVVAGRNTNIAPLLERAFMFLEDGEWQSAEEYCEKVLDIDPKCARAYLGKLMAELAVNNEDTLCDLPEPFDGYDNYIKAVRFADSSLKEKLEKDIEHINTRNENERLEKIYNEATKEMNLAETEAEFKKAADVFKTINDYKDSASLIEQCLEKAETARKDAILASERNTKRNKKIAAITIPVLCAIIAFVILLNTVIIPNYRYNNAVEKMKVAKVGDYIFWGAYEQDNNTSNGKEELEWLVLDKQDGKALVISKYALDCKPYNTSYTYVTWETCSLRNWLNNDFINSAFTSEEKALIPTVTVEAHANPEYDTNPGNASQDQIFLLSIAEANKYFDSNRTKQCKPTDCAVANGAYESNSGNCRWWLRSPGYRQNLAARVNDVSVVYEYGHDVDLSDIAVRPAMWIDLNTAK